MHEREREGEAERSFSAALLPPPTGRCQVCGAPHEAADPILCAVCGEPVLRCGWA
jgi:hypothetical protein